MHRKYIGLALFFGVVFSFACSGRQTVSTGAVPYRQVGQVSVPRQDTISLNGYAEFLKGPYLIIEGQRVAVDVRTEFKGLARNLVSIPPGSEVNVRGIRRTDGVIQASSIESKPNGNAFLEADVLKISDTVETAWVKEGMLFNESPEGKREVIGKIIESGPQVQRGAQDNHEIAPPLRESGQGKGTRGGNQGLECLSHGKWSGLGLFRIIGKCKR